MDIERGSLDEITRPASSDRPRTGSRPSSRVSLSSASLSRPPARITTPSLLESLPPEDISQQEYDLEVVEYQSSDSEDGENGNHNATDALKQLMLINSGNTEDSENISPDTNEASERPTPSDSRQQQQSQTSQNKDVEDEDEAIQDPKLRAAIKKMKKLDKILAQKIKREKEVKRQRIRLERELHTELERAKPEGRDELKEVKENTMRFLALAPPPSHNEGVDMDDDDDDTVPVTPVFATQPHLENSDGASTDRSRTTNASDTTAASTSTGASTRASKDSRPESNTSKKSASKRKRSSKPKGSKVDTGLHKKDGSDFIQRNIELASDASNVIAMTDDEKKRLEELLGDVEMLKEEEEETSNFNPFQLQVAPGLGFCPDEDEKKAMDDIDLRLQALLPRDDFESICSSSRTSYLDKPEFQFTRKEYQESLDLMLLGEKALRDTKEMRDQQTRLKEIEDELTCLQIRVESEMEYPRLSNTQLQDLLDLCSRASSRATEETNAIANSPRSPGQSSSVRSQLELDQPPPRLPDDVLRQLLEDARQELQISSSRLSTVREEEMRTESFDDSLVSESVNSNITVDVNERDMVLQSVSEDTIRELLQNPRATSRAMSRSSQDSVTPTPDRSDDTPTNPILTDNGAFTERSDIVAESDSQVFTPRRKLPFKRLQGRGQRLGVKGESSEFDEDDETPTPRAEFSMEQPYRRNLVDSNTKIEDLEESVDVRVLSMLADQREKTMTPLQELDEVGSQEEEVESDLTDEDFGLNDDESLESELRSLHIGTPSTNSRSSSQLSNFRTESGMTIEELRISNSAFDSRPSSKAISQGTPITPEPLPKPPSKASNVKNSARSVKSKAQIMISRSDVNATVSRAASETSTLRSDSVNTMVESSDFDYENDAEIREQLLLEEEEAILARKQQYRRKHLESGASNASSFQMPSPKPHPPQGGRRSNNGKSRKAPPKSANDSERNFSPPLI